MKIHIQKARLLDPSTQQDGIGDLFIADDKIVAYHAAPDSFTADKTINAHHHWVMPGLIDIILNASAPSTLIAATELAALSGVTSVCCAPSTDPVLDAPAVAVSILPSTLSTRLFPIGALTQGLAGKQLAPMAALKRAGCVALSNARSPISDTATLRHAFDYAATMDLPIIYHPLDPYLSQGDVHEGQASLRLGLPGIPASAETIDLARALLLQQETGVRLHIARLSTAASVAMIANAKAQGYAVTADVAIHHLYLTENDVLGFASNCHVQPPLRTLLDQQALIQGVKEGVIDIICTDHYMLTAADKSAPFAQTKPGIAGLGSLLPLALGLVQRNNVPLLQVLAALSYNAARLINKPLGTLAVGSAADIIMVDPEGNCSVALDGTCNPFASWPLQGELVGCFVAGR